MKFGNVETYDWSSGGSDYQYYRLEYKLEYKNYGLCLAWFFEPFDKRFKFWFIHLDASIPVLEKNPITKKYRVDKYSKDDMIKVINNHLLRLEKLQIFI